MSEAATVDARPKAPARPRRSVGRIALVVPVVLFAVQLVGALIVRVFLFKAMRFSTGSMTPAVLVGDRVLVRLSSKRPVPGEMVLFKDPVNPAIEYARRAVAFGGETVTILDGRPVIDGKLAEHCYVGPYAADDGKAELYVEFVGGKAYGVLHSAKTNESTCSNNDECPNGYQCLYGACAAHVEGPFAVATGDFFALGDNRDHGSDSRSWGSGAGLGVPLGNVTGHPWRVWMNPTESGRIYVDLEGPPHLGPANASLQSALDECLRKAP